MQKSIVITGCMGLIGGHFTRLALSQGYKVYGIDKYTYASFEGWVQEFISNPNFTYVRQDICDLSYLPDCDFVVHFAAESHVDNSIIASDQFFVTNVMGTKRMLDLVKDKKNYTMPVFVHVSTDEVYGDNLTDRPHVETDVLIPSNPYSASKVGAEALVVSYGRTYDLPYVIVRPTNNYGENQHPEKLIPKAIQMLQRGVKVPVHGKGDFFRYYLHADDTAEAVLALMTNNSRGIYNISADEIFSIEEIVRIIVDTEDGMGMIKHPRDYMGMVSSPLTYDDFIEYNFYRKGADVVYKINDSKLRNETGWGPKRKFAEEIGKIVQSQRFRW